MTSSSNLRHIYVTRYQYVHFFFAVGVRVYHCKTPPVEILLFISVCCVRARAYLFGYDIRYIDLNNIKIYTKRNQL